MKVFVTGHKGYIGSHLVELLKQQGHFVAGCDIDYFAGCEWEPHIPVDREIRGDIRDLTADDLRGYDCVMHLAAISNDPMGDLDPKLTFGTNRDGSVRLAEKAREAGVQRFLFSSSCSIYGKAEQLDLDENAALHPVSAYAQSKIETEAAISKLADRKFSPAYLRNATAYGYSRALRIDLVANNLLACALAKNQISILSDGTPWRPLIHCRDIARAFIAFMEAPRERIHNQAINVGGNRENYQVKDVADRVHELVPEATIVYTGEVGADPRNYRVKFDLLGQILPEFHLEYTLRSGLKELHQKFKDHCFGLEDFSSDRYVRIRTLRKFLACSSQPVR